MLNAIDAQGIFLLGLSLFWFALVILWEIGGKNHFRRVVKRFKHFIQGNAMTYGLFYVYLRDENNNPAVTLALLTAPNSTKVSFQLATRNPKDNFVKKFARAAAGGRLAKYPITIDMGKTDSKQSDIVDAIISHLTATDFAGVKGGPIMQEVIHRYYFASLEAKRNNETPAPVPYN